MISLFQQFLKNCRNFIFCVHSQHQMTVKEFGIGAGEAATAKASMVVKWLRKKRSFLNIKRYLTIFTVSETFNSIFLSYSSEQSRRWSTYIETFLKTKWVGEEEKRKTFSIKIKKIFCHFSKRNFHHFQFDLFAFRIESIYTQWSSVVLHGAGGLCNWWKLEKVQCKLVPSIAIGFYLGEAIKTWKRGEGIQFLSALVGFITVSCL